ncbi:PHP domain-containing protein [Natronococcus jeotgali]|uniref:histidinol-phosphatase n=1 Tax=Natronococcus jeotgali DSM 18795 TaxID=1227498 RepID=L9XVD3_9EURY|nr:PHP domain-containing protein [Natronococcus jeotgali]ELY65386.1 HisJ family histidinol phosphate phosphatase [Natronococcus jeotgali DSM 18795]
MYDFHAHTNYSDGSFLPGMVRAAEEAGLEGIGLTDHCSISSREAASATRNRYGFNLDLTYERRRDAIEQVRARADIDVYDAVEMDYDPRDEPEIAAFLEEANFQYTIGSVHAVEDENVQVASNFEELSESGRDDVVDDYIDRLVALIDSELFDVAAHLDLIERTPPLRGRTTTDHYERVARAFADSRTVPEINAGRATREDPLVHPDPEFLESLREYDVAVTLGTDSHAPDEIGERAAFLEEFLTERDLEPVSPPSLEPHAE